MGPGPRGPFQRTISLDGKPLGGPGGAVRRPMLIKQENMMGSPDSFPGNMGVCLSIFPLYCFLPLSHWYLLSDSINCVTLSCKQSHTHTHTQSFINKNLKMCGFK